MGGKVKDVKVLLVEDNPDDAELLQRAMGGVNSIVRADSLKAGIDLANQERFDMVVLDLNLPDSDNGIRTYTQFSAATSGQRPFPVVIYTGQDDPDLARAALRDGAAAFVGKSQTTPGRMVEILDIAATRHRLSMQLRRAGVYV